MGGNRIDLLADGGPACEVLQCALQGAGNHLNLQMSALAPDRDDLLDRVLSRCRAGVRLNLILDHPEPAGLPVAVERLRLAGARVCVRQPPSRWSAWRTWRQACGVGDDWRKLIVVDGRVGFIGGGVAGDHDAPGGWQRLQLQVQGPIVQRLQRLFVSRWQMHSRSAMHTARYFPPLAPVGAHLAVLAGPHPGRADSPFVLSMVEAVDHARHRVVLGIGSPILPRGMLLALRDAVRRGVVVDLHLPALHHGWTMAPRGRSQRVQLRHAGVALHERTMPRGPGTACAIDGLWSGIGVEPPTWPGSATRAEANLVVLDAGVAAQLERALDDGPPRSRPLPP